MKFVPGIRDFRIAAVIVLAALIAGCGDDKKVEKKAEPPKVEPPKVEPPKAKPAPKAEPAKKPVAKAEAPGPEWLLLGRREVKTGQNRFPVGIKQGRFNEVRVTVQGGPVTIDELVITFGNDEQFRPQFKHEFTTKSPSRVIDLPGRNRAIKHVDFVYRGTGTATVMLYGR